VDALIAGEKHALHAGDITPYFDGCLPIEVMANADARRCATAR
jgi:folate-dependent tRNA-U54 methylase TrmFO/GidA